MSTPEVVELGGGRQRPGGSRRRVLLVVACVVVLLAAAALAVLVRRDAAPTCATEVAFASPDGGDRVVYDESAQYVGDDSEDGPVLRYVFLSDQPFSGSAGSLPDGAPGARVAQLFLYAVDVDGSLDEGVEFEVGSAAEGRRRFAPVDVADDRLIGAGVRPGTGSLRVESADEERTCLRVEYANDEGTLTGTIALVSTPASD